jgi:hypothetical protein
MPSLTRLAAGTRLYHGTRTRGAFAVPDGPAWFAFDAASALAWAHWRTGAPPGRNLGEDARVLLLDVPDGLDLLDTRSRAGWVACGLEFLGDAEPLMPDLARALADAGEAGWLGGREVLLTRPADHLHPAGILRPNKIPAP